MYAEKVRIYKEREQERGFLCKAKIVFDELYPGRERDHDKVTKIKGLLIYKHNADAQWDD